ncbi:MAG: LysM peptidoglycan-binding domain-containing protein [Dysgonamonadaceae bacterium]|nr:LysM peptidoglycan-binding domain-containing protein [Dysgonamonadaceae bacterium]
MKSEKNVSSFSAQENLFFLHTIERGETVYSIASMYSVSIDDVYALNPESKAGIKAGDRLKIPQESGSYFYHTIQPKETLYSVSRIYQMKGEDIIAVNPGLTIESFTIGKTIRIPTNKVTTPPDETNEALARLHTESLLNPSVTKSDINTIKIALFLPFGLQEGTTVANASKNRMVEYYEGFLLALQDLKKKNISVQLQVYDTGSKTDIIKSLLKKAEMQDINLLIGGLSEEQIRLLANFSNTMGIPYIIPFTSKTSEPLNYYNIYQINTPQSHLYSKTSLAFYNEFKTSRIIFYDSPSGGKEADKSDLIAIMKSDLTAKKVSYKIISSGANLTKTLSQNIDVHAKNVIVPSNDSKITLIQLIEALKEIKAAYPEISVSMFGHPAWQIYSSELSGDFSRFNTRIYTIYYANPASPEVKSFNNKYYRWFSRELINKYPKYGILGYDTGMFFIQLLNKYGTAYDANINNLKYNGIQTNFHFERVNNWGGFINTNIYFVEFTPDSKINVKLF